MKNKLFIVAIVAILTFGSVGFALAAPYFQQTQSMVPVSDTANNNIGTTSPSNLRYNGFFKNLTVSGTCTGCGSGSTQSVSTSTNETAGRVPYWTTTSGTPAKLGEVATTTLTITGFPANQSGTLGTLLGGSDTTFTYWGLSTTSNPTAGNIFYSNGTNGLIPIATSSINVGTASALFANGANCTAGNAAGRG